MNSIIVFIKVKKKKKNHHLQYYVGAVMIQFSSVIQSCPTLCNPTNPCTSGLPVYHQLPEFTQTHVHWVSDAIQPSHPLSSPSPPTLNLSQHLGLFKWVRSLHQLAKVMFGSNDWGVGKNKGFGVDDMLHFLIWVLFSGVGLIQEISSSHIHRVSNMHFNMRFF